MKKFNLLTAVIAALVITGCATTGGGKGSSEPAEDIGNEWTLDFARLEPLSWSDGDNNSNNPPADTAEAVQRSDGGYDFKFTKYNQRIIIGLSRPQQQKVRSAANVEVIIDGSSTGPHKFRYHIGDADAGSDWNASESFGEEAFSGILNKTVKMIMGRGSSAKHLIIQSRGASTGTPFTPQTVTIKSITFICSK